MAAPERIVGTFKFSARFSSISAVLTSIGLQRGRTHRAHLTHTVTLDTVMDALECLEYTTGTTTPMRPCGLTSSNVTNLTPNPERFPPGSHCATCRQDSAVSNTATGLAYMWQSLTYHRSRHCNVLGGLHVAILHASSSSMIDCVAPLRQTALPSFTRF